MPRTMDWEAALGRHLELGIDKKKWKGGESFQIFGFACAFARFRTVNITLKGRRSVKTVQLRESLEEGSCESNAVDLLNKLV